MAEHGLTIGDLAGQSKPATVSKGAGLRGVTIAPKYRNDKGETWTGRGLQPRWLKAALFAGATIEQFKIAA
jgi:DNA-binding protein H-NS